MAPYVGQIVLFSLVTALMLYSLIKTPNLNTLEFTLVLVLGLWSLFLIQVYFFGLKYKIFWDNMGIRQQASGGPDVYIKFDEITRVESEISGSREVVAASRPFRRIAIYAGEHQGTGKFIDVSLKHFVADDVRKLMHTVHDRRPDLTLPKNWMAIKGVAAN